MSILHLIRQSALVFTCLLLLCLVPAMGFAAKKPAKPAAPTSPEAPFALDQPPNWQLYQAGECDTLTLFLQNSKDPLQQLFFFPRFGPVYMSQEQKSSDLQYESISGQSLSRRDMPVVKPMTPENFVRFMPQILQMQTIRDFFPNRPGLRIVETIAVTPQKKALDYLDTQSAIIRILFVQDNRLGEGLLAITTVPAAEFRSGPGGGIGMGFMMYGLTAAKGKLNDQLPELLKIGRSFKLSTSYEKKCKKDRAEDSPVLLDSGNSLKPVLDAMALVWEKRQPAEDMLAEKRADELQGLERLHRPSTGEVYAVAKGFSEQYLTSPQSYNISDLRPLPDDSALWLKPVLNGMQAITKK